MNEEKTLATTMNCATCRRTHRPAAYVYVEIVKQVYASLHCEECTRKMIKATVPITALLTGATVRLVYWVPDKKHFTDESGNIFN